MTDPITCPECQGARGQQFGALFLACRFCGGLGWVGAEHEPAEQPPPPPDGPPPAWEHRIWKDPAVASALPCRYCLGSRRAVTVQAGKLTTSACEHCAPAA